MNGEEIFYYAWAIAAVLAAGGAWLLNSFLLPGNWIVVALAAAFAWLMPEHGEQTVRWWVVGVLLLLALLGEIVEFAAGAAGAARRGGSRRAAVLALLGAIVGSIAGALVLAPLPFLGPLIGAVGGGAVGAFCGAWLGETWKGKSSAETFDVSRAALTGRLLGTVGKLALGAVMVVVFALDALLL